MAKRIHPLFPLWLVLGALLAVFLGERAYAGAETARMVLAVVAVGLFGVAAVTRVNAALSAGSDTRPVARRFMQATLTVGAGLVLYALIPLVFTEDTSAHQRIRGVLWAVWPVVLVSGLFPLVAMELAVAPVAFIPTYEQARVFRASERALGLALFISCLFLANFLADRHDTKWELSAGHQAVAGEQTLRAVRDLTKPVEVVLFYPRANDVAERVEAYLEPLAAANPKLTVKKVDFALAGDLAKDAQVTENGYLALSSDKVTDKIRLGTNITSARSALRRLDANFIKALVKVTTSKRVAYFTSGHGERAIGSPDKDDKRAPAKLLKQMLETWQFTVKELSVANGLAEGVPADAAMILIVGPERPFLAAEQAALLDATARGVRLFVALEAEREGEAMAELLGPLGLSFERRVLVNEQAHAAVTRTAGDSWFIYSTKFSSHASVTTMSRNAQRLATVFYKAGSLEKKDEPLERVKTEFVLHAMDGTFRDADGDLQRDPGDDPKAKYELAAAVTRTSTTGKRDDEARIFVLADADVVGDELLKLVEGNNYLFRDVILWLSKDDATVAPVISEDDVKIVHKKEDDSLIFYGTTFGLPALVMLAGWLANRRRQRS
jgi:hypothetical protein